MKLKALLTLFILALFQLAWAESSTTSLDSIAVIINDQVITSNQLAHKIALYQRELASQNLAQPDAKTLRQQVIKRLIDHELQLQMAKRADIQVEAEQINKAIATIAKQNGVSVADLRRSVIDNGLSYSEYRANIHDQLTIGELQRQATAAKITVSDDEVDRFLKAHPSDDEKNTEFHLKTILVQLNDKPTAQQISQAQTLAKELISTMSAGTSFDQIALTHSSSQAGINSNDLGWRKLAELPIIFVDPVKSMKTDQIKGPIKAANGFHILKLEGKRYHHFNHSSEQIHLRQIVLTTDAIKDSTQIKHQLLNFKQQIEQGTSFAKLAKQYSTDTFSKEKGGDMGWLNLIELPLVIQNALHPLSDQEMSDPIFIKNRGYLIQKLATRKIDDTKNFQRNQVKGLLYKRKFEAEVESWLEQLRNSSYIKIL